MNVLIVERVEERLVLAIVRARNRNGTTVGGRELVVVVPTQRGRLPIHNRVIIGPGIRVQRGVLDIPGRGAVVLVGSRTSHDLDLGVAAAKLGIYRRNDQAN